MDASDKASDDDIEGLEGELGAKKALTWAEPSGNGFVGWIVDDDPSLESVEATEDDKSEVCCGRTFKLEAV